MEKYQILLTLMEKQSEFIHRVYREIVDIDLSVYEKRSHFALKTQQLYTAIEDLFKQIAKAFENHVDSLSSYHKELLIRMNLDIPKIRPKVISQESFLLMDKLRTFRHFVRHAYDCELDQHELGLIQNRLKEQFFYFKEDLERFKKYVGQLADS